MNLVSNTGPLIALAKANQLHILRQLFEEVQIPAAVQKELLAGREQEGSALNVIDKAAKLAGENAE